MDFRISLVCFSLFLISYHFLYSVIKRSRLSRKRLPPGPLPLPLVGNILKLGIKPHISLAKLARIYGPVINLELGLVNTIVISSVDMAREVLQKKDASFSYRAELDATAVHDHVKSSIVFLHPGTKWRAMRRICASHMFSGSKLDASQEIRGNKVLELMSYIENCCPTGTSIDIGLAAFNLILNILSRTFFSKDFADPDTDGGTEFKDLICAILVVAGKPNLSDFFPALKMLDPQGIRRRSDLLSMKLESMFETLVNERLQERKSLGSPTQNDVLDALIDIIQENNGEAETEVVLSDLPHLFGDLFSAGVDTTSSTVEWAMAELLRHPDKLKIAKAELQDETGKKNQVQETDIPRLSYLNAVIKETLRLHPPVPFLVPRTVITDVTLGTYTVPKGARVLVNTWAMGRDPSIWERPSSFEPERFLNSKIEFKGNDFELIPFGAGRRMCPALPMASRMLHLVLGSLIHSFDWKLEDGVIPTNLDMDEKFGFTLNRARPLIAIPIKR
ncbi:Geraniol 8-hydroxylase-like protein [Drosera capensis]